MNRAPALGHRLEVDRAIKTTLTRDAWTLAMALMPQQPLEPTARKVSFLCTWTHREASALSHQGARAQSQNKPASLWALRCVQGTSEAGVSPKHCRANMWKGACPEKAEDGARVSVSQAPPSQFGCLEALEFPSPVESLPAGTSHAPAAAVRRPMDDIDTESDEEG